MSSEGGLGPETFFWENQTWGFSNSDDNSAGSRDKSDNQPPPTDTGLVKEAAPPGKKRGPGKESSKDGEVEKGKGGGESDDHELHIWTERERRKKMRNMFANLHALLPQLPPKADKSTIVDEAVNYIKTLEQNLQKLQKQKLEKLQSSTNLSYEASTITPQNVAYESREAFLADQGSSSNLVTVANLSTNVGSNSSNSISMAAPWYPAMFQTWTSSNVVLNICGDDAQISVCSQKKPGLFTAICYVLEKHKIEMVSAHVSSDCNRSMYMIQAHVSGVSDQFPEAFSVEEIYKQAAGEIMLWVSSSS